MRFTDAITQLGAMFNTDFFAEEIRENESYSKYFSDTYSLESLLGVLSVHIRVWVIEDPSDQRRCIFRTKVYSLGESLSPTESVLAVSMLSQAAHLALQVETFLDGLSWSTEEFQTFKLNLSCEEQHELAVRNECLALLKKNQRMAAIRYYRVETDSSLKDSKEFVDALTEEEGIAIPTPKPSPLKEALDLLLPDIIEGV